MKVGKDKAELEEGIGEVGTELEAAITELKGLVEASSKKSMGGLG